MKSKENKAAGLSSNLEGEKKIVTKTNNEIIVLEAESESKIEELSNEEADFLREKKLEIHNTIQKAYTKLGRIFSEVQNKLSNHKNGVFGEWFESLGFSRTQVYRLIKRYEFIQSCDQEKQKMLENLPVTLIYELVKDNTPEELVQQVLEGEITTTKELKEKKEKLLDNGHKEDDDKNKKEAYKSKIINIDELRELAESLSEDIIEKSGIDITKEEVKKITKTFVNLATR